MPPGQKIVRVGATAHFMFYVGRIQTIREIANGLPVMPIIVDKTGLTGTYDYLLKYLTDRQLTAAATSADGTAPIAELGAPPLMTALKEQLGLELKKAWGTVEVLVVDRFHRVPSEN